MIRPDLYADGSCIKVRFFVEIVVDLRSRASVRKQDSLGTAAAESGIDAPLFQRDGTVMQAKTAIAFPVMSFASGATNSMRGAADLSGLA
jgi:N-methylhydantoinase A/oxoprolinase/acetone carboxylase beta subunit